MLAVNKSICSQRPTDLYSGMSGREQVQAHNRIRLQLRLVMERLPRQCTADSRVVVVALWRTAA